MSVGNVTTKYLLPRNPVSDYAKGYDIFAFETNYGCNVPKFRRESDKASIGLDVVQNQEKKMAYSSSPIFSWQSTFFPSVKRKKVDF